MFVNSPCCCNSKLMANEFSLFFLIIPLFCVINWLSWELLYSYIIDAARKAVCFTWAAYTHKINMYIHVYVCVCVYVCIVCMCLRMCVYVCMYMYIYASVINYMYLGISIIKCFKCFKCFLLLHSMFLLSISNLHIVQYIAT